MTEINDELFFNDKADQSKFLDWAYERIKQEVQEIENMEKQFGTAEWYIASQRKGRPARVSGEEKLRLVNEIDKYRNSGYTYKIACECAGVPQGTYSKWRNDLGLGKYIKGDVRVST
jgi:hypothetical protein|tara:strand:- start:618 stop:968 length:351 start_codon:yes stop_codon:yes gene_type:complete